MKNPMVHFEIPVDDIDRAQKFYTTIFDWRIEKMDMPADSSTGGAPYYSVFTCDVDENNKPKVPGAMNGGMMKRANPGQLFTNYVSSESIEKTLELVEANGGTVLMPKTEIMKDMGWIAVFMDTEKNVMGLHEMPVGMKDISAS